MVIVTVSVARGQVVVVTVWEYQSSDQVRLASRTPPSDQQRRGFVVPVEPCVLGRLGVGQPQDEILQWLPLQRLHHQWPEQSRVPFLLHVALRIVLLGTPQSGRKQRPLLWSPVAIAMDPLTCRKSLRIFLLALPSALPSVPVQWAQTSVGHLLDMPLLEEFPTHHACIVVGLH